MLPWQRKQPKRYDIGEGEGHIVKDVETGNQLVYLEAMDLLMNGIKYRFQTAWIPDLLKTGGTVG